MKLKKSFTSILPATLIALLFFLSIPAARAETNPTARDLAQQVFDRDRGFNSKADAIMVLVSKNGHKRTRTFKNLRMVKDDLETQLIRFTSPADIEGTAFLTVEQPGWETDQFLYLPALRRTRRIVSSQKAGRFVNSDFTYEDMERHRVDDYDYTIIGSTTTAGVDCYILQTIPKPGTASQYARTTAHIAKAALVPLYAEYFDAKGKTIKQYKVLNLEKIQDIWTETTVMMEDSRKNHQTYIKTQQIEYNTDIDPSRLSSETLDEY
ncbi:MAG: outer membrane lipoprotein-sorting protein [Desulfobacterium sp.]|jgi:hypothetical protein|nr:outer membrane lipoprotein-sorting protein [Desulfobacterium sp.]